MADGQIHPREDPGVLADVSLVEQDVGVWQLWHGPHFLGWVTQREAGGFGGRIRTGNIIGRHETPWAAARAVAAEMAL